MITQFKTTLLDELSKPDPELYHLTVCAARLPHGRGWYRDVTVALIREPAVEVPYDVAARLSVNATPNFDDWRERGWVYTSMYLGDSFFTAEEADAIEQWLRANCMDDGDTFKRERQTFPVGRNIASVSAFGVGGSSDAHMFTEYSGFDCPVAFWGYYDVSGCELEGQPGRPVDDTDFLWLLDAGTGIAMKLDPADAEGKPILCAITFAHPSQVHGLSEECGVCGSHQVRFSPDGPDALALHPVDDSGSFTVSLICSECLWEHSPSNANLHHDARVLYERQKRELSLDDLPF